VTDRQIVSILCCLFAIGAAAQVNTDSPHAERIETGTMACPSQPTPDEAVAKRPMAGHVMCHYRIRLLPVSSFPQLPPSVAEGLSDKGCMIPQTYEAHEPENVIHGSFEKAGSSDWAVLCSVRGVTTLYVFFQSDLSHPAALRRQPDDKWLGVEWSFAYGSAWGILTVPPLTMPRTDNPDHDGIQDAFVEQSSVIHYYDHGHWRILSDGE
jgi:hypothetical protein